MRNILWDPRVFALRLRLRFLHRVLISLIEDRTRLAHAATLGPDRFPIPDWRLDPRLDGCFFLCAARWCPPPHFAGQRKPRRSTPGAAMSLSSVVAVAVVVVFLFLSFACLWRWRGAAGVGGKGEGRDRGTSRTCSFNSRAAAAAPSISAPRPSRPVPPVPRTRTTMTHWPVNSYLPAINKRGCTYH
ncbi:hypothetical protein R3P38DRAFT_3192550 [Favolaschia claudopus]|uniref:Uncharacterized protein n=1 Tax=Favolaschia claudopus TaxID=2862362 RepID=A0AAW0BHC0_9AGAR